RGVAPGPSPPSPPSAPRARARAVGEPADRGRAHRARGARGHRDLRGPDARAEPRRVHAGRRVRHGDHLPGPRSSGMGRAARARALVGGDPADAFAAAGLAVTPVDRATTRVAQTGAATLRVEGPSGALAFAEGARADYVPLLIGPSGGDTIDAPLVFAGWG